jgi:uncharacterized membrane protein
MPELSVGNCIRFGWETFKKRPGILIGGFLLAFVIPAVPGALFPGPTVEVGMPTPPPGAASIIASLAGLVLSFLLMLGAVTFALRAHDDLPSAQLADLWNPQPFWRFVGAEILHTIIVAIGLILLVIPGIIASVGLAFVPFAVVDRGAGPIAALKESWRITNGHKWNLFLLSLALLGINILGMLALVVGLLVTIPISWLAITHAYRTLAAHA